MTYAVRNARWAPLYDARLDTGAKDRKPALELVRRAEITQTTGEDWSNVALGGLDRADRARRQRARSEFADRAISAAAAAAARPRQRRLDAMPRALRCAAPRQGGRSRREERADEQQAVAEVGGFQVTFKIPGRVSVGANEGAKSLRVSTATIAPDLAVRSAPVLDPDRVSRSELQAD